MSGIMQELKEFRDMAKKRGSTDNRRLLDAFSSDGPAAGADWGACSPDKLSQAVQLITSLGGAITIGLSRDKGSHMLTLLLDGKKKVLWFNGDADLNEELTNVIDTLKAMN